MPCGGGSFTPDGAYDSLSDSMKPMKGRYTINCFQYQEDVGCVCVLNDCVNDVQVDSLQYCSDQDEIHATISKSFIRVDVPLVRSSCNSIGATACTGSGDPLSAVHFCYAGSNLGERVNLKVNSFDSEAGSFDLMGSGLKSISCLRKSFSKSGQDLEADSDVDSGTANRAHRH